MGDYWTRPKLRRLLSRAATGAIDAVVVETLDDLAHTRPCAAAMVQRLADHGVTVVSMAGEAMDGRWLAGETERHRQRIKEGQAKNRGRGERVGEPRWGYRVAEDGVHEEPDEYEVAAEQLARSLMAQGLGDRAIARALTDAGHTSRAGTPITHVQVSRWRRRARRGA